MSEERLEIPAAARPERGLVPGLGGVSPSGERIAVGRSYLRRNGEPWLPVSGEFHYSRCDPERWADELAKIKAGGVDVVSTYAFWIHHEEIRGRFDWSGRRDLRRFVELCAEAGLYAIVRIGPFAHGEVRNGGLPDWLRGEPFAPRSNDEAYLALVRRWYGEVGRQLRGLLFRDGGPVIGTQIENEYGHAGAPWEETTGVASEWVESGQGGEAHMLALKALAREAGIETPLYTCTAWGGAAAPAGEMLPLWGGYAYWPWIFYGDAKEHPLTPEFIFRDYHDDRRPRTYNFEPRYRPEDYPFSCCELGGGMTVFYKYRFSLPPESVSALAIVKLAGGCNFLGYYMYHGGTNPRGNRAAFLNEHSTPKLSYDFQAPLGECGQARRSYHELRLLHYFLRSCGNRLCRMSTVLPDGASEIESGDLESLRWAARADGKSGFLFFCNFQDHAEMPRREAVSVRLELPGAESLRVPAVGGFRLEAGVSCILPFHLDLGGVDLAYATAQPVALIERGGERVWFFASPRGMAAEYAFGEGSALRVVGPAESRDFIVPDGASSGRRVRIVTLSWEEALGFWLVDGESGPRALVSDSIPLPSRNGFRLEHRGLSAARLKAWPPLGTESLSPNAPWVPSAGEDSPFGSYESASPLPELSGALSVRRRGPRLASLSFDRSALEGTKDLVIGVRYSGDVGEAFVDGELVADNFANGDPWLIDLGSLGEAALEKGLELRIVPLKEGASVLCETTMAGRSEAAGRETGEILSIELVPVADIPARL